MNSSGVPQFSPWPLVVPADDVVASLGLFMVALLPVLGCAYVTEASAISAVAKTIVLMFVSFAVAA